MSKSDHTGTDTRTTTDRHGTDTGGRVPDTETRRPDPDVEPLIPEIKDAFRRLRPGRVRPIRRFAEEEIILPEGPFKDLPYRASRVPATAVALDAMHSGPWRRFFGMGDVQDGKTLTFTVIPTLYHLFEIKEDIGFAAPTKEAACDIFQKKIKPVIERSFPAEWPRSGPGSQGGQVDELVFNNGATVRFFGAKGGDEQRSSYTLRVMVMTEIDKMDMSAESSRETDPISQLEERTASFDESARIYGECTASIPRGRVNQEVNTTGTGTQCYIQCPFCGRWVLPIRQHFVGWVDATSEHDAHEKARWQCYECQALWEEDDKKRALRDILPVHRGQAVDPETGDVHGDPPPTNTFGLNWWFMHSPIKGMGRIAELEYRCEQLQTTEMRRRLSQFHWSTPYEEEEVADSLSMRMLAEHAADWRYDPLGAVTTSEDRPYPLPTEVVWTIGTIDVQKDRLYWEVDGYDAKLTRWVLLYSVEEIIPEGAGHTPDPQQVWMALDRVLGMMRMYGCDTVWVDSGYRHESASYHLVRAWCHTAGRHVHALVGRGTESMAGKKCPLPLGTPDWIQCRLLQERIDNDRIQSMYLWFVDVDIAADEVYAGLFRERGSDGYHYFPREAANEGKTDRARGQGSHGWIFSHYMRVKRETKMVQSGLKRVWVKSGQHDLWDLATYSLAGAYVTRAAKMQTEAPPEEPEGEVELVTSGPGIRTAY